MLSSGANRIRELDFIRGIAIFVVMMMHFRKPTDLPPVLSAVLYPLTFPGSAGVDLFFTLSGFLVGGLLLKEWKETGHVNGRRFLIRRAFKIWPMFYVLLAFHLIVGRHPPESFLWQNFFHLQNYLGTSIAQTWSLAVEEHFYLAAALMIPWLARSKVTPNIFLIGCAFTCVLVLVARTITAMSGELESVFDQTHYRLDSLLAGVMLAGVYWLKPDLWQRIAAQRTVLMLILIATVVWLLLVSSKTALARSIGYTIESIGFCCFIALMLSGVGRFRQTLAFRTLSWIGLNSYGLYLWHSLALMPGALSLDFMSAHGVSNWLACIIGLTIQFSVALTVGHTATKLIEWPFLRMRDRFFATRSGPVPL